MLEEFRSWPERTHFSFSLNRKTKYFHYLILFVSLINFYFLLQYYLYTFNIIAWIAVNSTLLICTSCFIGIPINKNCKHSLNPLLCMNKVVLIFKWWILNVLRYTRHVIITICIHVLFRITYSQQITHYVRKLFVQAIKM